MILDAPVTAMTLTINATVCTPLATLTDGVGDTTYHMDTRGRELEEIQPDGNDAATLRGFHRMRLGSITIQPRVRSRLMVIL